MNGRRQVVRTQVARMQVTGMQVTGMQVVRMQVASINPNCLWRFRMGISLKDR